MLSHKAFQKGGRHLDRHTRKWPPRVHTRLAAEAGTPWSEIFRHTVFFCSLGLLSSSLPFLTSHPPHRWCWGCGSESSSSPLALHLCSGLFLSRPFRTLALPSSLFSPSLQPPSSPWLLPLILKNKQALSTPQDMLPPPVAMGFLALVFTAIFSERIAMILFSPSSSLAFTPLATTTWIHSTIPKPPLLL